MGPGSATALPLRPRPDQCLRKLYRMSLGKKIKWEVQAVIVYIPMHDMLRKNAAEAVHAVPKHEGATTALPDG